MEETIKTREEIMDELAAAIKAEAKTQYDVECEVEYRKIEKNNGLMLQAVSLREPNAKIYPNIYIEFYLETLIMGDAIVDDVAETIVRIHMENRDADDISTAMKNLNKNGMLENVTYQLINTGKNKDQLCKVPHTEFLDLAAIYRVAIDNAKIKSSFVITNAMCNLYRVTVEELDAAARKNTEKLRFSIRTMDEIIAEMTDTPINGQAIGYPVWVVTNHQKINGAVAMLYPNIFRKIADKAESDLYILPSSIHEVLAMSVDNAEPEELKDMVGEVNTKEVAEDDVLSGNIYRYIREENRIVIVQ